MSDEKKALIDNINNYIETAERLSNEIDDYKISGAIDALISAVYLITNEIMKDDT